MTLSAKIQPKIPLDPKLIWVLFFFSGACGLIYEVVWTHQLSLIMGNTVYSLSAVLTAFMGGLALGSYLAGRMTIDKKLLLKVYGFLEIFIGLYCILLPFLFIKGAGSLYPIIYNNFGASFYLLTVTRLLISFVLLLIPTTLMGATLPILTEALLQSRHEFGFTTGSLYAVNSLGAVAGTLGAGFFLIPNFGIQSTTLTAAAINLVLGFSAMAIAAQLIPGKNKARRYTKKTGQRERAVIKNPQRIEVLPITSTAAIAAVIAVGVSGFAAMLSQVGWTRVLSLAIGSTIYAFTIIIAAFILGLTAGSFLAARMVDKRRDLMMTLAFVQLGIGITCAIILPLLGWSPLLFVKIIIDTTGSFSWLLFTEFVGIALLILPPTLLMGATFPLAAKIYYKTQSRPGKAVGYIYAVNTIGAIWGAALAGFVLIPYIGIHKNLILAATLFSITGIVLLVLSPSRRKLRPWVLAGSAVIFSLTGSVGLHYILESWEPAILSSGLYLLSHETELKKAAGKGRLGELLKGQDQNVKFYKEGLTATVAVFEQNGDRFLKIGGKTDATSFGDMPTQILLGHVPMMLHQNPKEALVIGLGAGITVGSVLAYSSLEKLDLVEISPEVVEAIRDYRLFDQVNGRPFDDAGNRVNLIVTDARNHVALTASKYDVIISEPSNPWMAGMSMLFTKEHWENCRKLLKPGGVICQWLPAYRMSKKDFLTVLATFASVFNYVSIWESIPGVDYLFVGSLQPQSIDYQRITKSLSEKAVREDLSRLLIGDVPTLVSYYLADHPQVVNLIKDYTVNTDDNVLLEYSAPRKLFDHSARRIPFNEIRKRSKFSLINIPLPQQEKEKLLAAIDQTRYGRALVLEAFRHRWRGELKPTLTALAKALSINPTDWNGLELEIKMRLEAVRNALQLGKYQLAWKRLQKIRLLPGQSGVLYNEYKTKAISGLKQTKHQR